MRSFRPSGSFYQTELAYFCFSIAECQRLKIIFVFLSLGVKQRMPIRAEGPYVGTDPVSGPPPRQFGLPTAKYISVYEFGSANRRDADRHGVCPYMRPNGRGGIGWVDGVSTYVRTDPEG